MKVKVTVTQTYEEMSEAAASFLYGRMTQTTGRVNIGLATGKTPAGLYERLVEKLSGGADIGHVHFYNIDEYCGVDRTRSGTCTRYLNDRFYRIAPIDDGNIHWLHEENADGFDQDIERHGGFDTILLGLGENGHIAFNEPGTAFATLTHIVEIAPASKHQHSEEFGGYDRVPDKAVTLGIKTIMHAQHIVLIANGSHKADILRESLTGPITESVPASVLQLHPNLHVFADNEAAARF